MAHRGEDPRIYFWRTASGVEVHLVVESGGKLIPLEVKLSATPRRAMADAIRRFRQDVGDRAMPGYVIHPGEVTPPPAHGVTAIPFRAL